MSILFTSPASWRPRARKTTPFSTMKRCFDCRNPPGWPRFVCSGTTRRRTGTAGSFLPPPRSSRPSSCSCCDCSSVISCFPFLLALNLENGHELRRICQRRKGSFCVSPLRDLSSIIIPKVEREEGRSRYVPQIEIWVCFFSSFFVARALCIPGLLSWVEEDRVEGKLQDTFRRL